ncbi:hypothetical protein [Pseudodesulfovibrio sp.]|uniref:hypothetical protein n=1 Tax=unclassified Pseudodesulfovibrio TaxID=2661612 RepID=UPI003AFF7885
MDLSNAAAVGGLSDLGVKVGRLCLCQVKKYLNLKKINKKDETYCRLKEYFKSQLQSLAKNNTYGKILAIGLSQHVKDQSAFFDELAQNERVEKVLDICIGYLTCKSWEECEYKYNEELNFLQRKCEYERGISLHIFPVAIRELIPLLSYMLGDELSTGEIILLHSIESVRNDLRDMFLMLHKRIDSLFEIKQDSLEKFETASAKSFAFISALEFFKDEAIEELLREAVGVKEGNYLSQLDDYYADKEVMSIVKSIFRALRDLQDKKESLFYEMNDDLREQVDSLVWITLALKSDFIKEADNFHGGEDHISFNCSYANTTLVEIDAILSPLLGKSFIRKNIPKYYYKMSSLEAGFTNNSENEINIIRILNSLHRTSLEYEQEQDAIETLARSYNEAYRNARDDNNPHYYCVVFEDEIDAGVIANIHKNLPSLVVVVKSDSKDALNLASDATRSTIQIQANISM